MCRCGNADAARTHGSLLSKNCSYQRGVGASARQSQDNQITSRKEGEPLNVQTEMRMAIDEHEKNPIAAVDGADF